MRLLRAIAIASFLGSAVLAHADTITWIVSIVGSGSLGTQTFADKRITLITSTTTDLYYEWGDFTSPPGWADYIALSASSTVSIEGIGTFFGPDTAAVDNYNNGLEIGDSEDELFIKSSINPPITPETIGPVVGGGSVVDDCDPVYNFKPCPGFIGTSGGNLEVTSFDPNSATGEEIFTVTPEPSTFALLGTGMIGMAGFARRKFSRS
jgi:PEP-CTERM motif